MVFQSTQNIDRLVILFNYSYNILYNNKISLYFLPLSLLIPRNCDKINTIQNRVFTFMNLIKVSILKYSTKIQIILMNKI